MDTELARTFITVVAAGNFASASERLHVTQSTVSARIKSLEEQLGCKLFIRNKAGTTLTPAGKRFEKHAAGLVRAVEHARQDVGLTRGFRATLTVGGRFGLWDRLLLNWLPVIRRTAPDVSVRAEIGFEDDLMRGLVEGRLDIGVMYTPQSRPGLKVEPLLEERLVLVTSRAEGGASPGADYVYVDWGPEFFARHGVRFPDFQGPALTVNIGWLGLEHILRFGGSGYFPLRVVRDLVETGVLHRSMEAPEFSLPAYVVYPDDGDQELIGTVTRTIREVVLDTEHGRGNAERIPR